MPIAVDVSDADAVEAAAERVEAELGPIDVWVNDAMVTVFSPVERLTPEEFRRVTEVTYLGYVWGTMAALKRMNRRNHGVIVQVGSALAYRSIPLQSAYCGAKHAIRGFTDALRCELLHERSNVHLTMVQMPALNTPQFDWAVCHMSACAATRAADLSTRSRRAGHRLGRDAPSARIVCRSLVDQGDSREQSGSRDCWIDTWAEKATRCSSVQKRCEAIVRRTYGFPFPESTVCVALLPQNPGKRARRCGSTRTVACRCVAALMAAVVVWRRTSRRVGKPLSKPISKPLSKPLDTR